MDVDAEPVEGVPSKGERHSIISQFSPVHMCKIASLRACNCELIVVHPPLYLSDALKL